MTAALIYCLVGLSYVLAILITAALWLAWRELVRIRRGLLRGRVNRVNVVNKAMPQPGDPMLEAIERVLRQQGTRWRLPETGDQ